MTAIRVTSSSDREGNEYHAESNGWYVCMSGGGGLGSCVGEYFRSHVV